MQADSDRGTDRVVLMIASKGKERLERRDGEDDNEGENAGTGSRKVHKRAGGV